MTDKNKQESLQDKKTKIRAQQEWAEQSGKNPDDLEITSGAGSRVPASGRVGGRKKTVKA